MTKKYHMRKRNLKGGDTIGQSFSNLGNSIAQGASSIWNKTKKLVGIDNTGSNYTSSNGSTYAPSTGSNYNTPYTSSMSSNSSNASNASSYKYGGKKGRKMKGTRRMRNTRKMKRGGSGYSHGYGYGNNSSLTNLASTAAPFSGVSAKVEYVGGRRKTRRSRGSRGSRR